MRRQRLLLITSAVLSVTLWAYACGDGTTDPTPLPPDPPRPTTVTVSPATAELTALGATVQLSAEVRDQNGQVMAGATVTWASSAAAVATVSASGLVTAVANGSATVTATAGSVSGSATVRVAQEVSAVAVTPDTATVLEGDTLRLTSTASDANGQVVTGAEFVWASGDTTVAVVNASGLVTGVGAGQAEVMATAAGVTGRATLTVWARLPTTVAVTPDTVVLTALEQTAQLTAEVRDQLGRVMEDEQVAWVSSDTLVATIDSTGLVTAVANGTATGTATTTTASGSATLAVAQEPESLTAVVPDSASLVAASGAVSLISPDSLLVRALGTALRLLAAGTDANGRALETGATVSWSSSDEAVATVDDAGIMTAVANGTATVTATAGGSAAAAIGSATVTGPSASLSVALSVIVRDLAMITDREALGALYHATDGDNWSRNDGWLTDAPLGEWFGVQVNDEGQIVGLRFSRNNLHGSLPPELGALSEVTHSFDFRGNQLTGPIPPELGELSRLGHFHLGRNQLTGPIPLELGNLVNVSYMVLSGNSDLSGPLPRTFLNLQALDVFSISQTQVCVPTDEEFRNWFARDQGFCRRNVLHPERYAAFRPRPCRPERP